MIKQLQLTNFRGHSVRYEFCQGRNTIRGKNEAGKTTIKEAIAFAWMGTDAEGTKNPDHLITVGQEVAEVQLTTPKSVLKRKKKRGSTSEVRLSLESIPDIKLTQTELLEKLQLSPEVFMSCWNVGYFMKLKADARLKVLGEVAKLDRPSLLASLLPEGTKIPSQVKYANPRIDSEALAGARRQLQNKVSSLQGGLTQIEAQLSQLKAGPGVPEDLEVHQNLLNEVEAALSDWELYEKNLSKYKTDLARWESAQSLGERLVKGVEEANLFLEQSELELKDLDQKIALLIPEGKSLKAKIEELKKSLKGVEMMVPQKRTLSQGDCPTCGQVIPAEYVEKINKDYNLLLEKYNQHERAVADHNKGVLSEITDKEKALDSATKEYHKVNARKEIVVKERTRLAGQLESLRKDLEKANGGTQKPVAPGSPTSDRPKLQAERDRLKAVIHSQTIAQQQRVQLEGQRSTHVKDIELLDWQIQQSLKIEAALQQLPKLETEKTLEMIQIPGVSMTLVDGDLVVCDDKGVDYRCLSDGRRMKVDVAFCCSLQRAAGPTSPRWLFVDNADLMDAHVSVPDGVQVFVAEVSPDAKTVEVVHGD